MEDYNRVESDDSSQTISDPPRALELQACVPPFMICINFFLLLVYTRAAAIMKDSQQCVHS